MEPLEQEEQATTPKQESFTDKLRDVIDRNHDGNIADDLVRGAGLIAGGVIGSTLGPIGAGAGAFIGLQAGAIGAKVLEDYETKKREQTESSEPIEP